MKQMQKSIVELTFVLVVPNADHAILDRDRVVWIAVKRMADDLRGPAAEVLAVEKRNPAIAAGGRRGGKGGQYEGDVLQRPCYRGGSAVASSAELVLLRAFIW